ncbi:hypothetical protein AVEN_235552-1 [Araneus ventricosus]|uniref:Uncharacterized protein n=1 Tax=Araneus ventricosus TaxID=182803 RepID=A0A4Y2ITX9_ARAVE|nr:hypothetical protein AVEN_235552-1 [Araneus ventricosus]
MLCRNSASTDYGLQRVGITGRDATEAERTPSGVEKKTNLNSNDSARFIFLTSSFPDVNPNENVCSEEDPVASKAQCSPDSF